MPTWVQWLSRINPLSYEVSALRGLLIGMPTNYVVDFGVLIGSALLGIVTASALLGRLTR
jgi:ABC-2 type transport system permease protein